MPLNTSNIKKILVISLSNIGDVILTFPVIDILIQDFPHAEISLVIGPKAQSLFHNNRHIENIVIFNKKMRGLEALKWINGLRREHFDLAVDLRHTAIPLLIGARKRTPLIRKKITDVHMKEKHLNVLKTVYPFKEGSGRKFCYYPTGDDEKYVKELLSNGVGPTGPFVIVAPGAADPNKRWDKEKFALVADDLIGRFGRRVVFVGDEKDRLIAAEIKDLMKGNRADLCGKLTLAQLGILIDQSELMLTNDTGPMHLASYLGKPVLAIFGPTAPAKYGPWNAKSGFIKSEKICTKCAGICSEEFHECTSNVTVNEVLERLVSENGALALKQ